jgi:hypothetical protein
MQQQRQRHHGGRRWMRRGRCRPRCSCTMTCATRAPLELAAPHAAPAQMDPSCTCRCRQQRCARHSSSMQARQVAPSGMPQRVCRPSALALVAASQRLRQQQHQHSASCRPRPFKRGLRRHGCQQRRPWRVAAQAAPSATHSRRRTSRRTETRRFSWARSPLMPPTGRGPACRRTAAAACSWCSLRQPAAQRRTPPGPPTTRPTAARCWQQGGARRVWTGRQLRKRPRGGSSRVARV